MNEIWNPDIVGRAARLQLLARQLAWGYRFGQHRSPKVTRSIEFAEHKEYEPGDSIRSIDWRVYARTERLLVRRQQADTEVNLIFVIDASADMALGVLQKPKWEDTHIGRAATLIASLCLLAQRRGERVGLWVLGGEGHELHWFPPRSNKNQLVQIMTTLAAIRPKGRANIAQGLEELGGFLPKRSILYVLSDFMEEPGFWGPILPNLAVQGCDIRLVHMFSQKEFELDFEETAKFLSLEYTKGISLDSVSVREDFREIVAQYKEEIAHWSGLSRSIYISAPLEDDLLKPFVQMIRGSG